MGNQNNRTITENYSFIHLKSYSLYCDKCSIVYRFNRDVLLTDLIWWKNSLTNGNTITLDLVNEKIEKINEIAVRGVSASIGVANVTISLSIPGMANNHQSITLPMSPCLQADLVELLKNSGNDQRAREIISLVNLNPGG